MKLTSNNSKWIKTTNYSLSAWYNTSLTIQSVVLYVYFAVKDRYLSFR